MDELFLSILNMSLTGAFVIGAICLVRLPLKKAPKIISYCLWMVAGFRLVFPFSMESVFSLIPFKAQTIPSDITMQPIPRIDSGIPFINNAVSSVLPAATPQYSANPLQVWIAVGSIVWIAGVTAMLIYGVVSFFILNRKMKGAAHIEENIYEAENIKSPFALGIFKPRIYLPTGLSAQKRSYIILHEQTHIRRRDHIIKFAAYFVLCLHWFNPLAWAAFLLMGVDMEMSCDERVLKEMGGEIKRDYSLSLLSLATEGRFIGGSPLAFGEGGIKERIKNVLNFKKTSRAIITLAVALAAVLGVGLALDQAIDRNLPMQGVKLSDLQPEAMIRHIVQATGAKDDGIIVPGDNFQLQVSDNFDWIESATISMFILKNRTGGNPYFACQLRIFPDERKFWVTEPRRQEPPQSQYDLRHYLDALKYLPQEHIRSLTHDNPDMYLINLVEGGIPDDNQPCVFYNMNGLADNNRWYIRLDVQPMYQDEEGSGYHGLGSDVIHVFYGDGPLSISARTYYLENITEQQKFERLKSITLYDNGTAWRNNRKIHGC
jgi:beta-lactamase regulating signal transducer with metallopeptidase domain